MWVQQVLTPAEIVLAFHQVAPSLSLRLVFLYFQVLLLSVHRTNLELSKLHA